MEILMLLIPMSVVLVLLIGAVFWWSVHSGQFDDLEGPAHRILADDDGAALPAPSTGAACLTAVKPTELTQP
jgi:cbb3-type cytochrome oxidase maturation protein